MLWIELGASDTLHLPSSRNFEQAAVDAEIHWEDVPPDAEQCGLPLLMCIGSLSEAMHRYEIRKLPASRAAEILLDFYEGRDLRFTRRRGQRRVQSTPEYAQRYGTSVRVPFLYAPLENPLDLEDLKGLDAR